MIGQKLRLKIIEIDRRRNRLILSERAAMQEWRKEHKERLLGDLKEGDVLKGRVTSLADFGAFVDLGGADGLIHLSELSWSRVSHPRDVLHVGDEVEVYVLNIDAERQRIGLSLKRLQPEPWSQVLGKYEIGQVVEATITKLANFGAFAQIDDVEGLIHLSELTDANITHPREVVKEGDRVSGQDHPHRSGAPPYRLEPQAGNRCGGVARIQRDPANRRNDAGDGTGKRQYRRVVGTDRRGKHTVCPRSI